jgi:ABC-type phosphate transport system auxiliary subunit
MSIRGIESIAEQQLEPTVMNLPELLQKCSRMHFRMGNQLVYALDLGSLMEHSRLRIRQG